MKRVTIKNSNGQITNQSDFPDMQTAGAWIEANKWNFGKPDRWLQPDQFGPDESTQSATDSRFVFSGPNGDVYEYFFPANYKYEIIDITQQVTEDGIIANAEKDQMAGRKVIAKVKAINLRKNLDLAGLNSLLDDPTLWKIERLLYQGSVQTALYYIGQTQTSLFTAAEVAEIVTFIHSLGY